MTRKGLVDGTWTTKDGEGNSVDVTISDGKAAFVATHCGTVTLVTTDKFGGRASAVIEWTSGWTSVLSKQGKKFVLNSSLRGSPARR